MTSRRRALDEIEAAHASVGGTGPGRRYATQQINQAYAVLLASQFQGYCRDLHTESVAHLMDFHSAAYTDAATCRGLDLSGDASLTAGTHNRLASGRISGSWASGSGTRLVITILTMSTERRNLRR